MFQTTIKLYLFLILLLFSCQTKKEEAHLVISIEDTLIVNEKALVKIYPNKTDWGIIKAYFDCEEINVQNCIDTDNQAILGCNKEFFVKNDTVLIQFMPTKIGAEKFNDIKVLLKNNNNSDEYLIEETTFSYVVK